MEKGSSSSGSTDPFSIFELKAPIEKGPEPKEKRVQFFFNFGISKSVGKVRRFKVLFFKFIDLLTGKGATRPKHEVRHQ